MIVVTTPTGQIGNHVVKDLLTVGERVRVVVRDANTLEPMLRDNVEIIEGSHGDARTIDRALDGAEALFWVVPPTPIGTMDEAYSGFTRPAAEAIVRHHVARVVAVTALGRSTAWEDRAGLVTASLRMVDLLRATGAAVRGLAMPGFMDNVLMQIDAIRAGRMFGPVDTDRKLPHTATRDIGQVGAQLLRDRSWSGFADHPVLGPEELSFAEMAAILTEVTGRAVRYEQVPFEAFKAQLLGRGLPESFAQGYVDMFRAKNEGMDNAGTVEPGSRGPTTFRRWAEEVLRPILAA